MGKHGPCYHCGVTTTPLWRNGPPNKPVLCNACGSRWRTKGSLANYTPLHAREANGLEETRVGRVKSIPLKPKERKLQKIKQGPTDAKNEHKLEVPYCDQNFRKVLEGDTSNRSSSGSATSFSESCTHVGTTEASELAGSAQSNVWESQVPSKKRTCVIHTNSSPVEKLTKDLYTIMHEQQQSSNYFSSSSELLYESETHLGSLEIGNGSVLLRYPNSKAVEEESEASSLPIDNKELKDIKGKQSAGGQEVALGPSILGHSNLPSLKRSRESLHVTELKDTMRSPKRLAKSDGSVTNPKQSSVGSKLICNDPEDFIDNNDGACFSPRTIFASPPDRCSLQFTDNDESSDYDLLLDFPLNNSVFPEAELLCHPWNQKPADPNISFAESTAVAAEKEETNFTKIP